MNGLRKSAVVAFLMAMWLGVTGEAREVRTGRANSGRRVHRRTQKRASGRESGPLSAQTARRTSSKAGKSVANGFALPDLRVRGRAALANTKPHEITTEAGPIEVTNGRADIGRGQAVLKGSGPESPVGSSAGPVYDGDDRDNGDDDIDSNVDDFADDRYCDDTDTCLNDSSGFNGDGRDD